MSILRRALAHWLRRSSRIAPPLKKTPHFHRTRLGLESLEDRLTPAVTYVNLDILTNDLIITDGGDGVSGFNNDNLTIYSDNANSQWIITNADPANLFFSSVPSTGFNFTSSITIPFTSVPGSQIIFNALDGNDVMTINRSLGNFSHIVSFDGGDPITPPGDKLIITGGSTVANASVNHFDSNSGVILFDSEIYQFINLEPVDISGTLYTNLDINLTFNADQAVLEDDGVTGNGISQLRSLNGSFETTIFQNPTAGLTVNMFSSDDVFNAGSGMTAAVDFSSGLVVNGDDDTDTINLNGPLNIGGFDAIFTAESIDVSSSLVTTGNITATASTVITGTATGLLQGNVVTLNSGSSIGTSLNPINTNANTLTPTVGATGGVFINETNSVTVTNFITTDGEVIITAGGALTTGNITAGGTGRNIQLTASTGDLTIGTLTATGDLVTLIASGGAVLDGNGATNNIAAQTLSIVSNTGVGTGANGAIETQLAGTLDVVNNIGNIFVDQTGNLVVTLVVTLGNVNLQAFGGSITGEGSDPGIADVLAIAGTLTLNATGGGSTIGNGTALEIEADTVNASTAGGNINIIDVANGFAVGLVTAGTGNVTLTATNGGSITSQAGDAGVADVVAANITLLVSGAGTLGNGGPLEINATTSLTANTGGGKINITDTTGGLVVNVANAGVGDVTLTALNGNLTALTPNNNVADVVGNVVILNATGTGTIGLAGPVFVETICNVLNSSTVNQTQWISELSGGAAIGLVTAGAGNVVLQLTNGGSFTSQTLDNVADVVGATLIFRAPSGGGYGVSFANPLEINGTTLNATIPLASIGMWFRDTAGGLAVAQATTVNNPITLQTLGGNLILTTVNAGTSIVRLDAAGSVTGTPGGTPDVLANNFRVNATAGITLETQVNNLAFGNTGGAVQIANSGALSIANTLGLATSSNTGTTTSVSASSPLTITVNTSSAGTLTLTAGEIADSPACADDLTVNPGVTVSSTAGDVVLRAGDDIITGAGSVVSAFGSAILTAGFGDLDACGDLLLNGTINAGTSIQLSAITNVCIGALSVPGGLVSVTSVTGAIIDCNDPPAGTLNITADRLLLAAATGIGSAGAIGTIETNVNFMEAQTNTGGIFLADQGSFDVGSVDAGYFGIRNDGATGDINVSAAGTIRILNNGEIIRGPGLVTVTTGVDLITSGANPTTPNYQTAVASFNGSIVLNLGRDGIFGLSNGDGDLFNDFGDIRAAFDVTITAGRDVIVNENTYVDAGMSTISGNMVITTGRDIRILQTNTRDSRIATTGGTITLTTGPGGEFELNTGNSQVPPTNNLYGLRTDLINGATFGGPGGDIIINADDVEIVDIEDVINAGGARVTIRPVTAGRSIDLGTNGTGTNLGLTDYELDRIVAGVVTIGSATTGPISVTNSISPTQFNTLHLVTPNTISSTVAGTLAIANLAAEGSSVTLTNTNTVGTLAGTTTGGAFSFTNGVLLTIGTVDGVVGITTAGGAVNLTSPDLAITQSISSGAGNVNLLATPNNAVIGVGTNVGTLGVTYGISNAELALINSTGTISIGDGANTGGMQVAASETVGPASLAGKNLTLVTGQDITVLGSLTGANFLSLNAGVNVNLTAAGTLGATLLAINFGQNNAGGIATIAGTLQSPNAVSLFGGGGDDTVLLIFTSPTALPAAGVVADGFIGNDLLDGPDFNQLFTLTSANAGTLAAEGGAYQGTINFSSFENLAGGSANDRFLFLAGGSVAGNIDGTAGGINKLDYTQYGSAVVVNLQTSTATAIGGTFANINTFCGYSTPGICSDFIGADVNNDWQITAVDAGTINAIPFMGFGNLFGGTQLDAFTFGTAGQLNCNIDGGAGVNTITGNDVGHTYSITGVNSGAIDTLFIGSVAPILPGLVPLPKNILTPAAPATRFTNVQNLAAGSGDDRFFFLIPGTLAGTINGGSGNNTLYGDNAGRTYTVTGGGTGTVSGVLPAGYTNVQNLIGGTGNDTFNVNSIGAVNTIIAGVQGSDTFTVANTGTGTLTLCGGDDGDFFTINNTGTGSVVATGDNGVDTFAVNNTTGPVTLNGNLGNDLFTVNGTGAGLLTASGDDGNDDFQVNNVGVGGADLFGNAGTDRFAVRAITGVTNINGSADGELANIGSSATVIALGVGNLDGILAVLNLDMGSGATTINIGDQTAAAANTSVEVTNSSITGFAPAVINYAAASGAGDSLALNLFGSNLGDTFNVRSTLVNPANPSGTVTTIQGGTGNDRFNLGSITNLLDGLLGRLNVQGNSGTADQVCFLDQGQTIAYNYILAATTFTRTGGAVTIPAITYGGMELFKAEAGSADDNFVVQAIGATTSADVNGNGGDDQFQITANTANALVASLTTNLRGGNGRDRFFVQSTAAATPGKVNMIGEADNDQFSFPNGGLLANGCIDGGTGIDTLDYSTRSTAALVNLRPTAISNTTPLTPGQQRPGTTTPGLPAGVLGLRNQTASGLFNGALNLPGAAGRIVMANATNSTIENVVGSALADAFFGAGEANRFEGRLGNDYAFGGLGNDILIGNEGDDSVFGEAGNDTIYGAAGADAMYGGTGFDTLLIDNCNDVRIGFRGSDRALDVGGLGAVDGGVIDLVKRVPPLTGAINDPRINFSNIPLEVFQTLLALRPVTIPMVI
ncbi:MAG: hypothetical protein U0796_09400 [Gemmatales bacterium]